MKKNMGNTDKIVRTVIAVIIAALYFTDTISGTVGIVLALVAIVFLLTSAINFCPLYRIVGINTCKVKE